MQSFYKFIRRQRKCTEAKETTCALNSNSANRIKMFSSLMDETQQKANISEVMREKANEIDFRRVFDDECQIETQFLLTCG